MTTSRRSARHELHTPQHLWLPPDPPQPAHQLELFAAPGTPHQGPWPPSSPETQQKVLRMLNVHSSSPTGAWMEAPTCVKASTIEAVHPGRRKAPTRQSNKPSQAPQQLRASSLKALPGAEPPLDASASLPQRAGSSPSPVPLYQRHGTAPSSLPDFGAPGAFRIPAGGHPSSSLSSPYAPRPGSQPRTGSRAHMGSRSQELGSSPAGVLSSRPGWEPPTGPAHAPASPAMSMPGSRGVLRSAGNMHGGVAAAAGSAGASAAESAIAAAALAWDLAPPLQQPEGGRDGQPGGYGFGGWGGGIGLAPPQPPPRLPYEVATAHMQVYMGRVVRHVEQHKAETLQWERAGKRVPAAVERRRSRFDAPAPLLSPQTLYDWELLLEPSRRQMMAHLHAVSGLLNMAPQSSAQPPPLPLGAAARAPDLGVHLNNGAFLDLRQGQAAPSAAFREEEAAARRQAAKPGPSAAFDREFASLQTQLQAVHGPLPPLELLSRTPSLQQRPQQQQQSPRKLQSLGAESPTTHAASSSSRHREFERTTSIGSSSVDQPAGGSVATKSSHPTTREHSLAHLALWTGDEEKEEEEEEEEGEEGGEQVEAEYWGQSSPQMRQWQQQQRQQGGEPPEEGPQQQCASDGSGSLGSGAEEEEDGDEEGSVGRSGDDVLMGSASRAANFGGDRAQEEEGAQLGQEEEGADEEQRELGGGEGQHAARCSVAGHFGSDREQLAHLAHASTNISVQQPRASKGWASSRGSDGEAGVLHAGASPARPGTAGAVAAAAAGSDFRFSSADAPRRPSSVPSRLSSRPASTEPYDTGFSFSPATTLRTPTATAATAAPTPSLAPAGDSADSVYDDTCSADDSRGLSQQGSLVQAGSGSVASGSEPSVQQSPVKTAGIGYTVVKSVQVWQPDQEAQQEQQRLQELELLQQALGDEDRQRAAKLRAGSRAAKALSKQHGAEPGEDKAAHEGASMLKQAPVSRLRVTRPAVGPGMDRPSSASSATDVPRREAAQQKHSPRSLAIPVVAPAPRHVPETMAGHASPSLPRGQGSSYQHQSVTTQAGPADIQDVWTG